MHLPEYGKFNATSHSHKHHFTRRTANCSIPVVGWLLGEIEESDAACASAAFVGTAAARNMVQKSAMKYFLGIIVTHVRPCRSVRAWTALSWLIVTAGLSDQIVCTGSDELINTARCTPVQINYDKVLQRIHA